MPRISKTVLISQVMTYNFNQHKICVPITGSTLLEFQNNLIEAQKQHNLLELRLDCIQDLTLESIDQLFSLLTVPAIASCRNTSEGGQFQGNEDVRLEILTRCLTIGFDYVEIELKTVKLFSSRIVSENDKPKNRKNQLIEANNPQPKPKLDLNSKHPKTKLILSYHNCTRTDNYLRLRNFQSQMSGFNPDIIKIVCTILNDKDNINLVRLLTSKSSSDQLIVLGMGSNSLFINTFGLILGNSWTTATLDNSTSSSSGLPTISQLKASYMSIAPSK